jgi:hypothetical protein
MMRYLLAILLPVTLLGSLGCLPSEPPAQTRGPVFMPGDEDAVEPVEASVQGPAELAEAAHALDLSDQSALGVDPVEHAAQEPPEGAEAHDDPEPTPAGDPTISDALVAEDAMEPDERPTVEPEEAAVSTEADDTTGDAEVIAETPEALFDAYGEILMAYVREDGLVDYGSLRRRRLDLRPILMALGELDPNVYHDRPSQEKLAFWINAYNLKMLDIIVGNYPIESSWWLRLTWPPNDIRHIKGIWTDHKFIVMDEEFTLAAVEQRFFRRAFDDPRVYLALTYASQSSPPLADRPYRGADLDRQLDEQVRRFLAGDRGMQIDHRNKVVRLSALFKPTWRGKEFVSRYGTDKKFKDRDPPTRAVLNFLTGYLPREDVYFLEVENYALEYLNYDWRLNDTARGY